MFEKIRLTILCLLLFSSGHAQFTNILISPTGCTEPSICLDPADLSRVVAATNCAYSYFSADSGQTWAPCFNDTVTPGSWAYDPCIVADYNGNFYYFHNWGIAPPAITVQKSINGGQDWSVDNNVPDLYDKEMSCVRPGSNELYTVYIPNSGTNKVGFSKSQDGALSWTPSTTVNSQTYTGIQWGAAPAVGKQPGQLYVVWENSAGVYFQRSDNDGLTWLPFDQSIRYFFNSGNGYNCMPSIACDLSNGPYAGTLYITWWELDATGTDTDIYFATSTDNGTTWTITSIASDITTNQKWPQITIDPTTGYIYIVYYSQYIASPVHDIRLLFSHDGGATFFNVPVSATPATVNNWYHHYIGNTAYNGIIRPAWTTNDSLFTALISESLLGQWLRAQDYEILSGVNIFPNPSTGVFHLSDADGGTVQVINSTGEIVRELSLRPLQYSTLDLTDQPAGLYLVTVKTEKGHATRRIIKV